MAHVKITAGMGALGNAIGHGTRIELNGKEMTEVRDLSLHFSVDSLVSLRMESYVEAPFEFDDDLGDIRIGFVVPEGCELIDVTKTDDVGRRWRCVRTVQP